MDTGQFDGPDAQVLADAVDILHHVVPHIKVREVTDFPSLSGAFDPADFLLSQNIAGSHEGSLFLGQLKALRKDAVHKAHCPPLPVFGEGNIIVLEDALQFFLLGSPRDDDGEGPFLFEEGLQVFNENGNLPLVVRHGLALPGKDRRRGKSGERPVQEGEKDFLISLFPSLPDQVFPGKSTVPVFLFFLEIALQAFLRPLGFIVDDDALVQEIHEGRIPCAAGGNGENEGLFPRFYGPLAVLIKGTDAVHFITKKFHPQGMLFADGIDVHNIPAYGEMAAALYLVHPFIPQGHQFLEELIPVYFVSQGQGKCPI